MPSGASQQHPAARPSRWDYVCSAGDGPCFSAGLRLASLGRFASRPAEKPAPSPPACRGEVRCEARGRWTTSAGRRYARLTYGAPPRFARPLAALVSRTIRKPDASPSLDVGKFSKETSPRCWKALTPSSLRGDSRAPASERAKRARSPSGNSAPGPACRRSPRRASRMNGVERKVGSCQRVCVKMVRGN